MRVLSWNLWWRFADWRTRQDAILAVLREQAADACGLQEVWADADTNQAALLAAELGLYWAWSPSPYPRRWQKRIGDDSVAFGNAVLSRYPIIRTAVADLPGPERPDGRTALLADLDTPAGRVPFVTTQFTSTPGRSALRCEQVRALARFVVEAGRDEHPPVITGDLNAEPDSDELRLLGGQLTEPSVPGFVLTDAWRHAAQPGPGHTWLRANPGTWITQQPDARIDYVLVGLPEIGGRGGVRGAHLAGAAPVDGVWPSDHAAVVADLSDEPGPGPGSRVSPRSA